MTALFNVLDYPVFLVRPRRVTAESAWREHIPFGMFAVELACPRVVVELGTHCGDSYCASCQAVDVLGCDARCYAVDHWRGDEQTGFYGPEVLADLRNHHDRLYGAFSRLLETEFDEAVDLFADGSIDLLHVDGCHEYEAARHDVEAWLPKLSERGVLLLHDTNYRAQGFGVWRLWGELQHRFEAFDFLHAHGLGMLAVGDEVPPGVAAFLTYAQGQAAAVRKLFASLGRTIVLHADLERQRRRLDASEADVRWLQQEFDARRGELEAERQRLLRLEDEVASSRERMRDANQEADDLRGRLRVAEGAEQHLHALLHTRTFRYSAPARTLYARIRRAANGDRSVPPADWDLRTLNFDSRQLRPGARRRVLVVSPDLLPLPALPTVGSGLRAWSLGQGLEAMGHEVIFSMPRLALERYRAAVPPDVYAASWEISRVSEVVERTQPDVILVSGWANVGQLTDGGRLPVPFVVDQHGPHILEREVQQYGELNSNVEEKVDALRRADFFTCAGERQLAYFRVWLQLAGWSTRDRELRAAAIPMSLSPELPKRVPRLEPTFVFGGVFLPWQDPSRSLRVVVSELERRDLGRLEVFGGRHPWLPVPTGIFDDLVRDLEKSRRVIVKEIVAHDLLVEAYSRAHVAVDLMRRNAERELAFTTRTVEYLWCGLPVIYNDYAELASYIDEYEAGWTLDPDDEDALRAVVDRILADPREVSEKSRNAQRLVSERLTWDLTIAPLDAFLRTPTPRVSPKETAAVAASRLSVRT